MHVETKLGPASLISDGCVIVIVFNKAFCALLHGSPPRAKDCYSGRKPEGSFFFFFQEIIDLENVVT